MIKTAIISIIITAFSVFHLTADENSERWSVEQANQWQQKVGWLVGCNFIPSTAINQLEMWQGDSFDLKTIDRELGLANELGFNCVRVFLHDLLWAEDSEGFLKRIESFLAVAQKHKIKVMFVFFDSCWDPDPALGKQRAPRAHVHNSGWVQSPGRQYLEHPDRLDSLRGYVQGVIRRFRTDERIVFWDLYNEPDNENPPYGKTESKGKQGAALVLLQKTFVWAREEAPLQPMGSGVWHNTWENPDALSPFEKIQLQQSDITTFHNYGDVTESARCIRQLRRYGRPLLCTEYMARPNGSTFNPVLGYFKTNFVGAFNWGFVAGKTQTIYPWDSWTKAYTNEPSLWFHDIFRSNGKPYRNEEVGYIRGLAIENSTDSSPTGRTSLKDRPVATP